MSFLSEAPAKADEIRAAIKSKEAEIAAILADEHDCDCEYCDRTGELTRNQRKQITKLQAEVKEHEDTLKRLTAYCKMYSVTV